MNKSSKTSQKSQTKEYVFFQNCILSIKSDLSFIFCESGQFYIGQTNDKNCCHGFGILFFPFSGFLMSYFFGKLSTIHVI